VSEWETRLPERSVFCLVVMTERKDIRHVLDKDLPAWIAVQDAIRAGKGIEMGSSG